LEVKVAIWMMNAHWYGYIDKSTGKGEAQTREVWGSVVDYNPAGHNRASIWVSTSLKTTMELAVNWRTLPTVDVDVSAS
jgi:hypothetical protein